jgi:hypothetical protein
MKIQKSLFMVSSMFFILLLASIVSAGDFDWINDFNIQAQLDPSGFKARLSTRFKIGDTEIKAVLSNVPDPADAYMVLRLGEMSSKPTDVVVEKYKSEKGKGWGVLAKSLGIKPGSAEFHALKQGNDIYNETTQNKDKGKGKGKGKK